MVLLTVVEIQRASAPVLCDSARTSPGCPVLGDLGDRPCRCPLLFQLETAEDLRRLAPLASGLARSRVALRSAQALNGGDVVARGRSRERGGRGGSLSRVRGTEEGRGQRRAPGGRAKRSRCAVRASAPVWRVRDGADSPLTSRQRRVKWRVASVFAC
jgi:hypothetical protein